MYTEYSNKLDQLLQKGASQPQTAPRLKTHFYPHLQLQILKENTDWRCKM